MTCPLCGRETPPEAYYCSNCGAALDDGVRWDPPEEPEPIGPSGAWPPLPPGAPSGRGRAWNPQAAWSTALVRAAVAFVVVVAVVLLNAILVRQLALGELPLPPELGAEVPEVPFSDTIKGGLLQFHAAHAVPLVVEVRNLTVPGPAGAIPPDARFDATLTLAPMLFTALAVVLLFLGGRAVARRAGGGPVSRGLSGATVAVPYALLSLVLSLLVSSTPSFEESLPAPLPVPIDLDLKLHAGHVAAFLWPLAIGVIAGFLGGLSTARQDLAARRPWGSRTWSALAGGWRMLAVGLLGSFLGLQVVAFAESDLPIPYGPGFFETLFEESTSTGLLFTDQTATLLPNMAVWVLVPSMGACDGVDLDAIVFRLDVDVICYGSFPGPGAEDALAAAAPAVGGFPQVPDLPAAPPIYLLFLLVPVVATTYGGWTAARRYGQARASEGALAGVGAGVVFALGVLALTIVSGATLGVSGSAGGFSGEGGLSAGADPVLGTLLALAWGLAGGAVGGLLGARSLPPEATEPVAIASSTSPDAAPPGWPWAGTPPSGDEPTPS
jgi:hypothetical protein